MATPRAWHSHSRGNATATKKRTQKKTSETTETASPDPGTERVTPSAETCKLQEWLFSKPRNRPELQRTDEREGRRVDVRRARLCNKFCATSFQPPMQTISRPAWTPQAKKKATLDKKKNMGDGGGGVSRLSRLFEELPYSLTVSGTPRTSGGISIPVRRPGFAVVAASRQGRLSWGKKKIEESQQRKQTHRERYEGSFRTGRRL